MPGNGLNSGRAVADAKRKPATDKGRVHEPRRAKGEPAPDAARALSVEALVHDIKVPITAVQFAASAMLDHPDLPPSLRATVQGIVEASASSSRMCLDLLDVTLPGLRIRRQQAPVVGLLRRALVASQLSAELSQHRIELDLEHGSNFSVAVDPDLLVRIIENLVGNALKYAPRGTAIRVRVRKLGASGVALRIEDQGPGVAPGERTLVFQRYTRLERDGQRHQHDSRGLGLAFCRLAAEAHGGATWVEQQEPCGAAFCVELPGLG